MASIGAGDWNSGEIQHPKWRKSIEQVAGVHAVSLSPQQRLRLARKLLRDGNDLVACLVMCVFQDQLIDAEHGAINVFEPLLPALRARALRILRRESRQRGRDHLEALRIVALAPALVDLPLLERIVSDPQSGEELALLARDIVARVRGDA